MSRVAAPLKAHVRNPSELKITVRSTRSSLWHTDAIEQRVAEALNGLEVDKAAFEALKGEEAATSAHSEVHKAKGTTLGVRLSRNKVEVSVEAASDLHLRGCKPYASDTQLRETIAAACCSEAMASRTDPSAPLRVWDPFCGSGTLLLESALLLGRRETGSALLPARRPAAEGLQIVRFASHNAAAYATFLDEAIARASEPEPPAWQLFGSDLNPKAIKASRHNVNHGLGALARGVSILDPQDFEAAAAHVPTDTTILTNLPWNVRAPAETYGRVGKMFRARAEAGAPVFVVNGNQHFVAHSRCTWQTLLRFRVGGTPAHLLRLVPK
ncbi:hypothetical protein T492DRAFT_989965 [Pavlovales sp. CCMP2436]|nr:hypothetical protein T492DRAFT_989965 [Pavlovales sp. CCMP2436]